MEAEIRCCVVLDPQAVKASTQLETDTMVDPEEVQRFGAGALADELDDAERQAKVRGTLEREREEDGMFTHRRECHAAKMLCLA